MKITNTKSYIIIFDGVLQLLNYNNKKRNKITILKNTIKDEFEYILTLLWQ